MQSLIVRPHFVDKEGPQLLEQGFFTLAWTWAATVEWRHWIFVPISTHWAEAPMCQKKACPRRWTVVLVGVPAGGLPELLERGLKQVLINKSEEIIKTG